MDFEFFEDNDYLLVLYTAEIESFCSEQHDELDELLYEQNGLPSFFSSSSFEKDEDPSLGYESLFSED